jgi:hypothetical protein
MPVPLRIVVLRHIIKAIYKVFNRKEAVKHTKHWLLTLLQLAFEPCTPYSYLLNVPRVF